MKKIIIVFLLIFSVILSRAQDKKVTCTMLNSIDKCSFPENINIPKGMKCTECTIDVKACEKLNKRTDLVMVLLHFKNYNTDISVSSGFGNIKLIPQNGEKTINPYAMLQWAETDFTADMSSCTMKLRYHTKLKTKTYTILSGKDTEFDLLFLFPKAKKGDRIVIDNIADVVIE
ncbi:MAG: hypothetical protein V2A54_00140 [Bacteroidota bacterium]